MNTNELKIEMLRYGDSGEKLAKVLEITPATFSNKLNNNRTEFTQSEIMKIKERYSLSAERVSEIFFDQKVS